MPKMLLFVKPSGGGGGGGLVTLPIGLRFDGNFNDYYSNTISITASGGATLATGSPSPYSGSGYLNANFGRVSSSGFNIPSLSATDFTIECWVYRPTDYTENRQGIVSLGQVNGYSGVNFYYYVIDGGLVFNNGLAGNIAAGTIPVEEWTHIAAVMSSGQTRLYIGGVDQEVVGYQTPLNSDYKLNIGNIDARWNGASFASDILIDELRISSTAIYTENFSPTSWAV